ncbi:MAG: type I restriction-modification system subunit M N-terminal domain-containing protein [Veillonella sp.]|nr:type I restriction-modification system subunit M N-terminal domain-containing protein [Veillonella sp.]
MHMITGEIKNKVDKIWENVWAAGLTNPLSVIEQITYLMFIRALDDQEINNIRSKTLLGADVDLIFP